MSFVNQAEIPLPPGSGQPGFSAAHFSNVPRAVVVVAVPVAVTVAVTVSGTEEDVEVVVMTGSLLHAAVQMASVLQWCTEDPQNPHLDRQSERMGQGSPVHPFSVVVVDREADVVEDRNPGAVVVILVVEVGLPLHDAVQMASSLQ
jgi:hypothetical protein